MKPYKKNRSIISKPGYTLHMTKLKLLGLIVFLGYVSISNLWDPTKFIAHFIWQS